MERNVVSVMTLILLLFGMLVFTFNVPRAKGGWTGTVYIRADGSIDPPDAPIMTYDNITYTLVGDIFASTYGIVVERDNIIIDGMGHALIGGMQEITYDGVTINGKFNVTVKNIDIKGCDRGISVIDSCNNTFIENNMTDCLGITLLRSFNNVISKNNITNGNTACIALWISSNNTLTRNTMVNTIHRPSYDDYGIWLVASHNNNISENYIKNNREGGIYSYNSSYNNIFQNIFVNSGLHYFYSYNNTVMGNLVNGRPLVYLEGVSDINIESAGQVILVSCNNIVVENLDISNACVGVELWQTNNTLVSKNNIKNCLNKGIETLLSFNNTLTRNNIIDCFQDGIHLWGSNSTNISENNIVNCHYGVMFYGYDAGCYNNTLTRNNIQNNYLGFYLTWSSNNKFYHNSFLNNQIQMRFENAPNNICDDGYPSGGNYWSDYIGVDQYCGPYQNETGSDGIGDTPYIIDANNVDHYPLMAPYNTWGDWKHYHNYTEIVNTLLYLNDTYPNIVDVFSVGKSWQNQDIYCIKLTNETNTHPKPKILFVGYHHARELISAELPLYFAVQAATNYSTNETITHMLNYSEIYIIPALNVDGFEAVSQNEWQRKNTHPYDEDNDGLLDEDPPDDEDGDGYIENLFFQNETHYWLIRWEGLDDDGDGLLNEDWVGGVDLNRNYGYQWNATVQSGSPYPKDEDYRGPAPFSEPETQAVRDLALSHYFKYAISFHSGTKLILYPWGYTKAQTPHNALFKEIAGNLSSLTGVPYKQSAYLYTSSGLWEDWMYGNKSTYAFTCEIYGNNSAWQYETGPEPNTWWEKGVFQFFNPDPNQIETVIQRWLPVFTYMANRAITEAYNTATTNVTSLKTVVCQGYTMNITVTVANKGEFTETFNVTLYANTTTIATKEITLENNASTILTFTWNTSGYAKGNYTISAYAWPVQGEAEMLDNTFVDGWILVSIVGDVNGDGIVEGLDLSRLARAFGAYPSHPKWDPNLDINNDNYIDGLDISTAARNYGQTDP